MKTLLDKRIAIIIAFAILFAGLFAVAAYFVVPGKYVADSTVRIVYNGEKEDVDIDTEFFAALMSSREAIESAKADANINKSAQKLESYITTGTISGSDVITVKFVYTAPKKAQALVEGLVAYLSSSIGAFDADYTVQVVEAAALPTEKSVNVLPYIIIGLIVGVAAGFGLDFFISARPQLAKDEEEVTKLLGIPLLAVVPDFNKKTKEYSNEKE